MEYYSSSNDCYPRVVNKMNHKYGHSFYGDSNPITVIVILRYLIMIRDCCY